MDALEDEKSDLLLFSKSLSTLTFAFTEFIRGRLASDGCCVIIFETSQYTVLLSKRLLNMNKDSRI